MDRRKKYDVSILCIFVLCCILCSCNTNKNEVFRSTEAGHSERTAGENETENEPDSMVWFTDHDLSWSKAESDRINQILTDSGWITRAQFNFISPQGDSVLEDLRKRKERGEEITYISVHDRELAEQIVEEGYGAAVCDMSDKEDYPGNKLDIEVSDFVRDLLGNYVVLSSSTMDSHQFFNEGDYIMLFYSQPDIEAVLRDVFAGDNKIMEDEQTTSKVE